MTAAETKGIYIGGFPAKATFAANAEYGGCGLIRDITFMPNYKPALTSDDTSIILNHMIEQTTYSPTKIFDYFFRIKNVNSLNLVTECNVPSAIQIKMKDTNNDYIKKGIQFGYGDYYECVNNNMVPSGDLVFSFKFYVTSLPETDMNLVSLVYKTPTNLYSGSVPNGKLPVWFNLIKLGFFLGSDGLIKMYHMGLPHKLTQVFSVDTGYTITITLKKLYSSFYVAPLDVKRLVVVYINGVKSEEFVLEYNFGAFKDVSGTLSILQNNFLYIGDYSTRSIDRYNYAFKTPNPLNSFGPSNSERTFSSTFLNMQDIIIFENATVSLESGLIPSNCLIGVPGASYCFLCVANYALDSAFSCQLKSSLASYIVFSNNYDLMIECGLGLFYNTELFICQNCPSDCAVCSSITSCSVKKQGCTVTQCSTCDSSNVCLTCNDGYVLDPGLNQCKECIIASGSNHCFSCTSIDTLTCLTCFDSYYYNTGSSSCEPCDSTCKTCEKRAQVGSLCTSCYSDKYLVGTTCLPLPNNIFLWKTSAITRKCFPTCTTCTSSDIDGCTACYSQYVKVFTTAAVKQNLDTHSCDSVCPATHYMTTSYKSVVGTYCLPCETLLTNCISCYQKTPTTKIICKKCNPGFFVSIDTNTFFTNTCDKCDSRCVECSGSSTNCVSCASGQVIQYNSGTGNYDCVTDPRTLSLTNRVCPYNKFLYQGQCLDSCPESTYRRKRYTDDCTACVDSTGGCYKCDTETAQCSVCHPHYKLDTSFLCFTCNQNSIQCCNVGQGTEDGSCSVCTDSNAADCFSPSFSTQCNAGYIDSTLGVCKASITNCNSYSYDATSCLMCTGTNLNDAGTCSAACSGSKMSFVSKSTLSCEACDTTCATCTFPLLNNRCPTCQAISTGVKQVGKGCLDCANKVI